MSEDGLKIVADDSAEAQNLNEGLTPEGFTPELDEPVAPPKKRRGKGFILLLLLLGGGYFAYAEFLAAPPADVAAPAPSIPSDSGTADAAKTDAPKTDTAAAPAAPTMPAAPAAAPKDATELVPELPVDDGSSPSAAAKAEVAKGAAPASGVPAPVTKTDAADMPPELPSTELAKQGVVEEMNKTADDVAKTASAATESMKDAAKDMAASLEADVAKMAPATGAQDNVTKAPLPTPELAAPKADATTKNEVVALPAPDAAAPAESTKTDAPAVAEAPKDDAAKAEPKKEKRDFAAIWQAGEVPEPYKKEGYVPRRVKDLRKLATALEAYYADKGAYPVSKEWDGRQTCWGKAGKEWIKGLTPKYIDKLPSDPRYSDDCDKHYIYRSNGKGYKLIAHNPEDLKWVIEHFPEMKDPARPDKAYGVWSSRIKE